jgi:hypothetical protein
MTGPDLARIEQQLGIQLPVVYKGLVTRWPFAEDAGTTEGALWDDADALIDENLRLREKKQLPQHLFVIGNSGSALFAIDVREADPAVWYVEHDDWKSKHSGETDESFATWAPQQFER